MTPVDRDELLADLIARLRGELDLFRWLRSVGLHAEADAVWGGMAPDIDALCGPPATTTTRSPAGGASARRRGVAAYDEPRFFQLAHRRHEEVGGQRQVIDPLAVHLPKVGTERHRSERSVSARR
jgi:hypothetical protein